MSNVIARAHLLFATLVVALLSIGSIGCRPALVPLTQELREQHNLNAAEIKNLQLYTSHQITLRRELESGGRQVTGAHKLVLTSGKTIEEVVVEEKTPGVAVEVSDHTITVSFEAGTSLVFSTSANGRPAQIGTFAESPDPFPGNDPSRPAPRPLPASGYTGNHTLLLEKGGTSVVFQSRLFEVVGESIQAHLLIDAESLEQVVKSRKVLKGIRLPSK